MFRPFAVTVALVAIVVGVSPMSSFAQETSQAARKVVTRVTPQYPTMARNMNIRGSVKVELVVSPTGVVKSVEVKGGHPLLAQAAQSALREWKFEPAAHETRESIEIKFNPE